MFVGHYGVSFATKKVDASIPLWVLFLAVQWLDVIWAPLVLLGIEKVRIVPGFTATNPLDLYYMPYTHSLVAALVWSAAAAGAYHLLRRASARTSLLVGFAVLSHWILDFVVHRPDLPLYDNTAKVGLGLWDYRAVAFGLEAALLLGGMAAFFRARPTRRTAILTFGVVMLGVQAYVFFGPPPISPAAVASTALAAYGIFAFFIWFLADRLPSARTALVLGFFLVGVGCHRTAPVQRNSGVGPVVKDTAGVVPLFKVPAPVGVSSAEGRTFKLRDPGQRDSLRATLRKERALWRATSLRDYQFLLRVGCFCPGTRGWLLMEVRSGKLLRARDSAGKSVALNDWNTLSIDGLFDHLEQTVDIDGVVQVAFDPRWHFPASVSTVRLPGPDTWGIIEARGLRPI